MSIVFEKLGISSISQIQSPLNTNTTLSSRIDGVFWLSMASLGASVGYFFYNIYRAIQLTRMNVMDDYSKWDDHFKLIQCKRWLQGIVGEFSKEDFAKYVRILISISKTTLRFSRKLPPLPPFLLVGGLVTARWFKIFS